MGSQLGGRSAGDDLETFELGHFRSIKLGANEKSEDKKKMKSLTFRQFQTSKRSLSDPRTVQFYNVHQVTSVQLFLD